MSGLDGIGAAILGPALVAGLLVTLTHVPLGMQVLRRGIVFIDLAIAQIAGLGVIVADTLGFEPHGPAMQVSALCAATSAALLLTWTERRWPQLQEAIIGVAFVLASSVAILLLAGNPHGAEHFKDLLAGQILWVDLRKLPLVALVSAVLVVVWFGLGARIGRIGFYVLFACAVTVSVQLVGLFLVFATLVIPALTTAHVGRGRLSLAYSIGVLGYAAGLLASALTDLPSGPMIVCTMAAIGLAAAAMRRGDGGA